MLSTISVDFRILIGDTISYMANFLSSTVLPGDPIPKHEHKRMGILLVVVVIVAIVVLVWLVIINNKKENAPVGNTVANPNIDPRIAEILNYKSNITEQQKKDYIKEIARTPSNISEKERQARIAEILEYSKK